MSSDSIPGVLGIVSPVESAFGGCFSCSCSKCVDAISSWPMTVLYPSAGAAFALLIWQWLRRTSPIAVLTTQDLGVGFSATSPWIHCWDLFVGRGLRYTFSHSVNSLSGVSAFLLYSTFDLFLLSAMFSCTTLGHASFGTSWLVAVGIMSEVFWTSSAQQGNSRILDGVCFGTLRELSTGPRYVISSRYSWQS